MTKPPAGEIKQMHSSVQITVVLNGYIVQADKATYVHNSFNDLCTWLANRLVHISEDIERKQK